MPDDLAIGLSPATRAIMSPDVPSRHLRAVLGQKDSDQFVEALARGEFARVNGVLEEELAGRAALVARKEAAEREAARITRKMSLTRVEKSIAAGEEEELQRCRWSRLGTAVLWAAALITLASAMNVAAAYCVDTGAWTLLADHPLLAYVFVVICPAAGVGGVLCIAGDLETDEARRRFRLGLGAATLVAWLMWLIALAKLYALQALLADLAGRRLPDALAGSDTSLHAWLLVTQILGEILAGALLKLRGAELAVRGLKFVVKPNPVYEFLAAQRRAELAAAQAAAAELGQLADFERRFNEMREGFVVACRSEVVRLADAAQAAQAKARAEFLAK